MLSINEQYELVAAHTLPSIDITRGLDSGILTRRGMLRFQHTNQVAYIPTLVAYIISYPLGAAILLLPIKYGGPLAVVKVAMQLPILILSSLNYRRDLLKCLCSAYEFWFFSTVNLATCIVFCLQLSDMRVVSIFTTWWSVQLNICGDARLENRDFAGISAFAASFFVYLMVIFGLDLIPETHSFNLLKTNARSLTSEDFLMNAFSIILVLITRTAYRKHAMYKRKNNDARVATLMSYRCRTKFQLIQDQGPSAVKVENANQTKQSDNANIQQLRMIKWTKPIAVTNVLIPLVLYFTSNWTTWYRWTFQLIAWLGFIPSVAAFSCIHYKVSEEWVTYSMLVTLQMVSTVCSLVYIGVSFAHLHRILLYHIVTSFDFVFLSLQFTLSAICFCDVIYWDLRSFSILNSWLWIHWILTLDALTPKLRHQLGIHRRNALWITIYLFVVQGGLAMQLMFVNEIHLQDRVLWYFTVFGHAISLRPVSMFLSRTFTTQLWCARIIWRLVMSNEDDLISIQGMVEFYGNPTALKAEKTQSFQLNFFRSAVRITPQTS